MAIQNVQRWQWILAGLLIGLALGYLHHLPAGDWQKTFGDTLTQHQFEEGLVREQSGLRWFRNLVVYPERVEGGGKSVPIFVVAGEYFDGRLEMQNGQRVAIWRPRCYVAEELYLPLTPSSDATANTVLAYLKGIQGVQFTYAWWRDPRWGIGIWTVGSVLVIGVIWPTALNLLLFGNFFRPRQEKGMDLSQVGATSVQTKPSATAEDWEQVRQLGAALEADLAASGKAIMAPAPVAPEPARTLTATPAEAVPSDGPIDPKAFGKGKEDFYPTELKTHPHDAK